MKNYKIAYLGPKSTFSNEAAITYFGENNFFQPVNRVNEVFDKIMNGDFDFGVVPAENSVGGSIGDTLDLFIKTDLKIYDQTTLNISQTLMSKYERANIKRIYSHPQSFFQCANYIKNNFADAELVETSSNAQAAIIASKTEYAASIGPKMAATEYGLNIIDENINDNKNNQTKFFIISRDIKNLLKPKSLIIFSVPNKPGALFDILKIFKRKKINMTKIESRPSKEKNWEYVFIIEYENSENIKKNEILIKLIKKISDYFDYLGSY